MAQVKVINSEDSSPQQFINEIFAEAIKDKRHLTKEEITILEKNSNRCSCPNWSGVWVSDDFCPDNVYNSHFVGFVILGKIRKTKLQYHDLQLETGIVNCYIRDCIIGDDVVVKNVRHLVNYVISDKVILFNIQEMMCTKHSKFGNGILKEGEDENVRIWIEIANENGGRKVLPFEEMIPADAYLWSRYRDDKELQKRFFEMTELGNNKKWDTMGFVGSNCVIKNTVLIKDVKFGEGAYVKGAMKLKNITVCSSIDEPSQIGEGVEMVNGIMGYGSNVFYQAVAVRFVIGRNCQLKYGARLLNSVLGDNSTVSCCEILNNLIFPFHEQHHNTSFLIASTLKGQSNIAAGAMIGSNHNSRSSDGEIYAGRGFWPGLCSDFKHNSKFASFTLVAKGSYQYELNILYPFSLVTMGDTDNSIRIMPAYWFMFNMFAMIRNNSKFKKRDKRKVKVQFIETDPFAPDTMQEVFFAMDRLIHLTGRWLRANDEWFKHKDENLYDFAKEFLIQNLQSNIELEDSRCMKKYGAVIIKPAQGYREYRKIMEFFAVKTLVEYSEEYKIEQLDIEILKKIETYNLYVSWLNIGGQVIPEAKVHELFSLIKSHEINSWSEVHNFYAQCQEKYLEYKASYAIYILEQLFSCSIEQFTPEMFDLIIDDVIDVSNYMYESSVESRKKDYTEFFRTITYANQEEMNEVLGTLENNEFLNELKVETKKFNNKLVELFKGLV
ncbi:MAG: DUF4954 family protein [Treponema sp.]|nr:DUF4954 family protein [Treponema sp.]